MKLVNGNQRDVRWLRAGAQLPLTIYLLNNTSTLGAGNVLPALFLKALGEG